MMDCFTEKLRLIWDYLANTPEAQPTQSNFYHDNFLDIIFWKDPVYTLEATLTFNIFFWVIVYFQVRFLGVCFILTLIIFLHDTFYIHPRLTEKNRKYYDKWTAVCDVCRILARPYLWLRETSRLGFALAMSFLCWAVYYIQPVINGYGWIYILTNMSFLSALFVRYLPEDMKQTFYLPVVHLLSDTNIITEEELVPSLTNQNRDLDSLYTERTPDSLTNSLLSDLSSMPGFQEEEHMEITEDDLLPIKDSNPISLTPGDLSSDSDSEHKEIDFRSSHFNGDSSSEEEQKFAESLTFSEDVGDTAENSQINKLLSNVAAVGGNLISSAIQTVASVKTQTRKYSSSDSEFELIDSKELDQ